MTFTTLKTVLIILLILFIMAYLGSEEIQKAEAAKLADAKREIQLLQTRNNDWMTGLPGVLVDLGELDEKEALIRTLEGKVERLELMLREGRDRGKREWGNGEGMREELEGTVKQERDMQG